MEAGQAAAGGSLQRPCLWCSASTRRCGGTAWGCGLLGGTCGIESTCPEPPKLPACLPACLPPPVVQIVEHLVLLGSGGGGAKAAELAEELTAQLPGIKEQAGVVAAADPQ